MSDNEKMGNEDILQKLEKMEKKIQKLSEENEWLRSENNIKDVAMGQQAAEIQALLSNAKSNPVVIRNGVDYGDMDISEENVRQVTTSGDAEINAREVDVSIEIPSMEKLERMKFMEEMVVVKVHDTTDKNEDPFPTVWNDGKPCRFRRGREERVPRKFLEVLARAKFTTFGQVKVKDANGDDTYAYVPHTAHVYPFDVVEDPNPRGRDWLRGVIASAH